MILGMLAAAFAFLDEGASAQPEGPAKRSFIYKTVANPPPYEGTTEIRADVYAPMDGQAHPVVVWFHGGALINGSRADIKLGLAEFCAKEGIILVSADYRLGPEIKAPEIMADVRDLMAWVREKGPELFGADPERIVAAGSSAGGYLAQAVGAMAPPPNAVLSLWGYGDILADWYTKPCAPYSEQEVDKEAAYAEVYKQVLTEAGKRVATPPRQRIYPYLRHEGLWTKEMTGFDPVTQRDRIVPFCPRLNVTPAYPPTLLIHGEVDDDVPVSESIHMAAALKENGVEHELMIVPGAGHTLKNATDVQVREVTEKVHAFLRKHLEAR